MKRKVITIITIAVIVQVLLVALFFSFNDILLGSMTRSFRRGIQQSDTAVEILDIQSVCGKLNGNGNGINYFGAALVKADSVKQMDTLAAELMEDFDAVEYTLQEGVVVEIPYLEHRKLSFDDAELQEGETYYCIYFYIHDHPASNIFDIRGY